MTGIGYPTASRRRTGSTIRVAVSAVAFSITTIIISLLLGSSSAQAQGSGGTLGRGGQKPFISVTVNPSLSRPIGPGTSFPSGGAPCHYYTLDGRGNLPYLIPGLLYEARCRAWRGQPAFTRIGEAVPNADGSLPAPMDRIRRELLLSAPPPATSPAERALVGAPTWFWMPEPARTRTNSIQLGGFTASISARPVALTIEPGDGATLNCQIDAPPHGGSGGRSSETEAEPCLHVFETASKFVDPATATQPRYRVTWTVSWSTNRLRPDGTSPSGTLPDAEVIGPFNLEAIELQAVNR